MWYSVTISLNVGMNSADNCHYRGTICFAIMKYRYNAIVTAVPRAIPNVIASLLQLIRMGHD